MSEGLKAQRERVVERWVLSLGSIEELERSIRELQKAAYELGWQRGSGVSRFPGDGSIGQMMRDAALDEEPQS